MRLQAVSELTLRPVDWLWPCRLALGKLALLEGDPDLGKTFLALDWCARLSRGEPFPEGGAAPRRARSIYFHSEDGAADTIKLRLEALGADCQQIFVIHQDEDAGVFRLPAKADDLDRALSEFKPRLVVIDPIVSFLDAGVQLSSDISVRRALMPLARLARHHGCAIVLIRHLNKAGGKQAIYRGAGSIGFLALCRSAWLVAADRHNPGRNVLAQLKNNLAPPQPSLAYTFERVRHTDIDSSAPNVEPMLRWLGPTPCSADDLLGRRPPGKAPERLARAKEFLLQFLDDGPRSTRDIWAAGRDVDLTKRTMQRAGKKLAIKAVDGRRDGRRLTFWLLDGQELPDDVTPMESKTPLADKFVADYMNQYPRGPLQQEHEAA